MSVECATRCLKGQIDLLKQIFMSAVICCLVREHLISRKLFESNDTHLVRKAPAYFNVLMIIVLYISEGFFSKDLIHFYLVRFLG